MENQFKLNIPKPCSQNFNEFVTTTKGGFCQTCEKEVIDFTRMNSEDIINYFKKNYSTKTCGRFKSSQLKTYNNTKPRQRFGIFTKIGLACLSLLSLTSLSAQDIKPKSISNDSNTIVSEQEKSFIVKGNVTEDRLPMPGVNITLENSTIGTTTDFDGNFEFPIKLKKGDVLVFSILGMETKKVTITDKETANQVVMQVDMDMTEIILMGDASVEGVYTSEKSSH